MILRIFLTSICLLTALFGISQQCQLEVLDWGLQDTVRVRCASDASGGLGDIPAINPLFTDVISVGSEDVDAFRVFAPNFDFTTQNFCGIVYITAFDNPIHPTTCGEPFINERIYQITTTDGGSPARVFTQVFVSEILPAYFIENSSNDTVSCLDNWMNAFDNFKNIQGGAKFLDCNNDLSVTIQGDLLTERCDFEAGARSLFTITDICGGTDRTLGVFEVIDTIKPRLTCPQGRTFEIGDPDIDNDILNLINQVTVDTGCGDADLDNDYTIDTIDFTACLIQQFDITMVAADNCGNEGNCRIGIEITNTTEPLIDCPPNELSIICNGDFEADSTAVSNWLALSNGTDFLGNSISPTNNFTFSRLREVSCNDTLDITFRATDRCTRFEECITQIIIRDENAPVIANCPSDTIVLATDPGIRDSVEMWIGTFDAFDLCNPFAVTGDDLDRTLLDFACATRTVPVTFMIDDLCPETDITTCVSQLTIENNVVAQFDVCPDPLTVQCGDPATQGEINVWSNTASASNNLNETFTVTNDYDPTLNPPSCGQPLDVVFQFVDQCSDTTKCNSMIIFEDDLPPILTCPGDTTFVGQIDIIEPNIVSWIELALGEDQCNIGRIINNYSRVLFSGCDEVQSNPIVFIVADSCGLEASCSSILTIDTDKQPTINCPDNLVLECGTPDISDLITVWLDSVTGTDFQQNDLTVTSTFDPRTNLVTCSSGDIEIEFNLIDNCGFTADCMRTLEIVDTEPPTITCPPQLNINSTERDYVALIEDWATRYDAQDNCLAPNVDSDLDLSTLDVCNQPGDLDIQFTAIDPCGFQATCNGRITFNLASPSITCPTSIQLECGDPDNLQIINNWLRTAESLDNNSEPLAIINDFDPNQIDSLCQQQIIVTFTSEDDCSRNSDCAVSINIEDTQPPVLTCPDQLNLLSGDPDKETKVNNWIAGISPQDCNFRDLTSNFDPATLIFNCMDEVNIPIIFTASDSCNTSSMCDTNIRISNDIVAAISNCGISGTPLSLECGDMDNDQLIADWIASITAQDNLGNPFAVDNNLMMNNPEFRECDGQIIVEFSIEDQCSSGISCTNTIVITDTTTPIISCPNDTIFILEDPLFDNQVAAWIGTVSATDNCNNNTIGFSDNYAAGTINLGQCDEFMDVPVTFEATDMCQLTESCQATLRVSTISLPSLACPMNQLVLECGDATNDQDITDWLMSAEGLDADGNPLSVNSSFDPNDIISISCAGLVEIDFSIIDNCLREDSCSATIEIIDTTPPSLQCPDDITIQSTDPNGTTLLADWAESYTSIDNCSMTETDSDFFVPNILCNLDATMTVTFESRDSCNLLSSCDALITIDKSAPQISNCTNNLVLECGEPQNDQLIDAWISSITAVDNAGNPLAVASELDRTLLINNCSSTAPVIFTAQDNCNTDESCTAQIQLTDSQAPIINSCPANIVFDIENSNLQSEVDLWRAGFEAQDLCNSFTIEDNYDISLDMFDCGTAQEVTFIAIDSCGNVNDNCVANISFENNIQVDISCPDNISVKCNEDTSQDMISAFLLDFIPTSPDEFTVSTNFDPTAEAIQCSSSFSQEVVFELVDRCGNFAECSSFIEFIPAAQIYIPNIFRPSEFGDNGTFRIGTNEAIVTIASMTIYSRWGDIVYNEEDFDPSVEAGWNGRDQFGRITSGVFTYKLVYQDVFGNPFETIGTLTLFQ